jgi:hypothetical protein
MPSGRGRLPWIDDLDTAIRKGTGVAGRDAEATRDSDGGDKSVRAAKRPAATFAVGDEVAVHIRGQFIEREDAIFKNFSAVVVEQGLALCAAPAKC